MRRRSAIGSGGARQGNGQACAKTRQKEEGEREYSNKLISENNGFLRRIGQTYPVNLGLALDEVRSTRSNLIKYHGKCL